MTRRGTVAHPDWVTFLPKVAAKTPCVMIFVQRRVFSSTAIGLVGPTSSHCFIGLTLTLDCGPLCVLNFYHQVPCHGGHGLDVLFDTAFDPDVPTVLGGNFNTHSGSWSFPGAKFSPWASPLEAWWESQTFFRLNPPFHATCCQGGDQDSILDFLLANSALLTSYCIPETCSVDFDASLGSDHASLGLSWMVYFPPAAVPLPGHWKAVLTSFDAWAATFAAQHVHVPRYPTADETTTLARDLDNVIDFACQASLSRTSRPKKGSIRWWSLDCTALMHTWHGSAPEDKKALSKSLHHAFRTAK
jgi:hypothetical protein